MPRPQPLTRVTPFTSNNVRPQLPAKQQIQRLCCYILYIHDGFIHKYIFFTIFVSGFLSTVPWEAKSRKMVALTERKLEMFQTEKSTTDLKKIVKLYLMNYLV